MVIALPAAVRARLAAIEADEGVPVAELIHQAVDVWSRLDADGRKILGIAALQLVVERMRRPS
ncbi:hypothetical protein [Antarcticirhabdus aurantiaca]|uniref:hypothetical protein n=1 Tax=Antarcticirhabdus aurantiaca TaxID=2606717 RepID=UPI00131AEC3F|nr:hypothetical protein [Antarcticirhabdus aurantiaca]